MKKHAVKKQYNPIFDGDLYGYTWDIRQLENDWSIAPCNQPWQVIGKTQQGEFPIAAFWCPEAQCISRMIVSWFFQNEEFPGVQPFYGFGGWISRNKCLDHRLYNHENIQYPNYHSLHNHDNIQYPNWLWFSNWKNEFLSTTTIQWFCKLTKISSKFP